MQEFTKKDCVGIGEEVSLKSRVVVLAPRDGKFQRLRCCRGFYGYTLALLQY